jgi:hypothetical protein
VLLPGLFHLLRRFTGEALEDEGIGMFGEDDDEVREEYILGTSC